MDVLVEYNSTVNGDELDRLEHIMARLDYFFMDPIKKWRHKNTRPWKLLIQILKIIVFTSQLVIFGSDMAKFINYKEEMQQTFKQLFLKDWDPSADATEYPGPLIRYAVYTRADFNSSIDYAVKAYSNITQTSVGQFGFDSASSITPGYVKLCLTHYLRADFNPTKFSYNYSVDTETNCNVITDNAEYNHRYWQIYEYGTTLKGPIDFNRLVSATLTLPLRTVLLEDAATGVSEIVCFNVDNVISYDNSHRTGQIFVSLTSNIRRANCVGTLDKTSNGFTSRRMLNIVVMLFCIMSSSLCIRSLWRAKKLLRTTEDIVKDHGRRLTWSDRFEFIDFWLVLIIINDLMVAYATIIISSYDRRLLETDNYTICSLLLGIGNFLSWAGLLRYLSFFQKYNLLIVTLRKSFFHVLRFMLCTTLIYSGFCFCGWIVFGPYHFKFRQLSTTTECLFALINGDDMFETFALLKSNIGPIWWFSRIYLYLFVSLFIYVVLSLFIALIMDAYEIIKQYSEGGFPKTRLQSFYTDRDITQLLRTF